VEPLLARWRVRAFASDRAEVVEHLLRLHAVVEDHLDDADADLLPAIAATLRPGQLTQAHRAVLSGLPARERSAFVGLVLGGAEPRERAAFRRCLPALTRARQRLVGHRGNLRSTAPRRHAVTALPDERNY
jgi:hypothetical protein